MSWSLALQHGDLALGGTRLATVTSSNKLIQDLRCTLLEPMGTDDLHPEFGSLIDGGLLPNGTIVTSPIGGTDWARISLQIEAELQRIMDDYQSRQLLRARSDQLTYKRPTIDPGEALLSVAGIEMTQIQTTLLVHITLEVGTGKQLTITVPVTDASTIAS